MYWKNDGSKERGPKVQKGHGIFPFTCLDATSFLLEERGVGIVGMKEGLREWLGNPSDWILVSPCLFFMLSTHRFM